MQTHRPVKATARGWFARRLLVTLALAVVLMVAGASVALAATGHPSNQRRVPAAETRVSPAEGSADESGRGSSSSFVPLVLAGIVILAAFPTLPRYPRSGY